MTYDIRNFYIVAALQSYAEMGREITLVCIMNIRCQYLEVIIFDRGFELAITWNAGLRITNCHTIFQPISVCMAEQSPILVGQIYCTFLKSLTVCNDVAMSDNGWPTSNAYFEFWNGI